METESSSLLELQMEETHILDEVELSKPHISTQDECSHHVVLMEDNQHTSISCITSTAMDFEFTNADLEQSGEFSIDNNGMFGITENDMEVETSECEDLFRESQCFPSDLNNKSYETLISNSLTVFSENGSSNSCRDVGGLKLQIIPLDNLKYVSTVQTNKGLHILAVPRDITVNHVQDQFLHNLSDNFSTTSVCSSIQDDMVPVTATQIVTVPTIQDKTSSNSNFTDPQSGPIDVHQSKSPNIDKGNLCVFPGSMKTTAGSTSQNTPPRKEMVSLLKNINCIKNRQKGGKLNKKQTGSVTLTIPLTVGKKQTHISNPSVKCNKKLEGKKDKVTQEIPNVFIEQITKTNDQNLSKDVIELDNMQNLAKDNPNPMKVQKVQNTLLNSTSQNRQVQSVSMKSGDGDAKKSAEVYCCEDCPAKYSKKGHLNNHRLVHLEMSKLENKPVKLNQTENGYETNIVMSDNEIADPDKIDDTIEEQLKEVGGTDMGNQNSNRVKEKDCLRCEVCSMTFNTKGNLTRHQLTHTNKTSRASRFECRECGKGFLQKCDLKRHSSVHSGSFPFTCDTCNKGFLRKSDMVVHVKFHLKEKTFSCKLCSKAYSQSGDLSRHVRQSHKDACQFSCRVCGVKYTSDKPLRQHMRKQHPDMLTSLPVES